MAIILNFEAHQGIPHEHENCLVAIWMHVHWEREASKVEASNSIKCPNFDTVGRRAGGGNTMYFGLQKNVSIKSKSHNVKNWWTQVHYSPYGFANFLENCLKLLYAY